MNIEEDSMALLVLSVFSPVITLFILHKRGYKKMEKEYEIVNAMCDNKPFRMGNEK